MTKIVVFGNSGSGKSTLAKNLVKVHHIAHLDLDSVAWAPSNSTTSPPSRMPISESTVLIERFLTDHTSWVIEGCYSDLLAEVLPRADELIFLNLPMKLCVENAKARPWEPHKYESKQAQDANLDMLIDWIKEYENRTDTFSKQSHQALYDSFGGAKTMYTSNNHSEAP
ncbi:AAA family ATPase [Alteromonas stellipolaris]|jgi:adenylate kinase family enzyme|uniref:AAA family ATPase n=1 Tax=Alteromonas stellipolaris TaxID=233316 RepID=UPI002732BD5B|nr:AAA family ATPase [Alteromonas stellipolaris]MDP2535026.1 AAA family ATPase [Alteromonas stellipolaris]MDP2595603.1 AAA family ATPase [Alteromonas stellipolaris]